jgi:hypothetical protein
MEKSLSKMIRTRARVERSSMHQVAAASGSNTGRPIPPVSTFTQLAPACQEHHPTEETHAGPQMQDGEETVSPFLTFVRKKYKKV